MPAFKSASFTTKTQLILLIFLAIALNFNTLFNGYVVDDVVVLTDNTLVQKGFRGIPEILTTNLFYGVGLKNVDLPGGRYRPFSLVIFAIEHQFFGDNPYVSHLINVLLFALLVALLFILLKRHIFKSLHTQLAFVTCLIFVVHPIHTEVIANVKSRDEILAFIFIIASSLSYIRYTENRSFTKFIFSLLFFFIALLTRESAVPMVVCVPLVAYFFFNQTLKKALLQSIPFFVVFCIYFILRLSIVGLSGAVDTDIRNAPFLFATPTEAFATKIFIVLKYFWILVFPHPLSFDYSYNQIPYIEIFSFQFLVSFLILTGLIVYSVYTLKNRSLISFSVIYFFATIFLFTNILFNIGAPFAERLLFQPSLAICIVFALLYIKAKEKQLILSASLLIIIVLLFSFKTYSRNSDWKDDETLCFSDIKSTPNSLRLNLFISAFNNSKADQEKDSVKKNHLLNESILWDKKVTAIFPDYPDIYADMGIKYLELTEYDNAQKSLLKAYRYFPNSHIIKGYIQTLGDAFYNEGNRYCRLGNVNEAIINYTKALKLNKNNSDAWNNLSKCYLFKGDMENAENAKKMIITQEHGTK